LEGDSPTRGVGVTASDPDWAAYGGSARLGLDVVPTAMAILDEERTFVVGDAAGGVSVFRYERTESGART